MNLPSFDIHGLTRLPFDLPGRIYRSPMPYGDYDPHRSVIAAYREAGITGVVVLAEGSECLDRAGIDLLDFYHQQGLAVIHCPIPDFSPPEPQALEEAFDLLLARAQAGENTAVHCHAGVGRTGVFMACLARRLFGMDGDAAIVWVKKSIPDAVETPDQVSFVKTFAH
jgi:protein-tyrosine phosphatase